MASKYETTKKCPPLCFEGYCTRYCALGNGWYFQFSGYFFV